MQKQKSIYFSSLSIDRLNNLYQKTYNPDIGDIINEKLRKEKPFDPIMDYKIDYKPCDMDYDDEGQKILKSQLKVFNVFETELHEQKTKLITQLVKFDLFSPEWLRSQVDLYGIELHLEKCKKIVNFIKNKLPVKEKENKVRITDEMIQQARDYPLTSLVGEHHPAGVNRVKSICPFHNDTKPSLQIDIIKNKYKCFVCDKWGDSISYLMDTENLSFIDAVKKLCSN